MLEEQMRLVRQNPLHRARAKVITPALENIGPAAVHHHIGYLFIVMSWLTTPALVAQFAPQHNAVARRIQYPDRIPPALRRLSLRATLLAVMILHNMRT